MYYTNSYNILHLARDAARSRRTAARRIIPRQLAATNQKHEVHANRRSMPLCSCRSHFPVIDSHRFTLIYCLVLQSQVLNHLSDLQLRELVNFGASLSGPDVFDIRSMERSIAEFHRESGIRKGCDAMPVWRESSFFCVCVCVCVD